MEYKFLATYVLILFALLYSFKQKLGLERVIVVNSLRALLQLVLLGYLLSYIFRLTNPAGLTGILFLMILYAAYTAQSRIGFRERGYLVFLLSIFFSSSIVIVSLMLLQVVSFKAYEMIPVGGMVIGNSLNVCTLTADRFKSEVRNTTDVIESMVALGAGMKEAFYFQMRSSVRAALIPTINSLQTVGLIHIPGITTGMLLAGADPLQAISYQLVIMYMMVSVALFSGFFTVLFSYKKILHSVEF